MIKDVKVSGSLSLVTVELSDQTLLKSIVIDTPDTASYLEIDREIHVLFKETEVVIGLDQDHQISLQNRIAGHVSLIEKGALISKIVIKTKVGEITAVISSNAVNQLNLEESLFIIAMIKLNEIMLSA